MKDWNSLLAFLCFAIVYSCGQPENKRMANKNLFDLDSELSFDEIIRKDYQKVPVDINMFEKKLNDSISINLIFDNDLKQVEIKSWVFNVNNAVSDDEIIALLNQNEFSLITPICKYDSMYSFFAAIDNTNKTFIGKRVTEDSLSYFKLSYYYPQ